MSKRQRYKNAGVYFAEECSIHRSETSVYVDMDTSVNTPYGTLLYFDGANYINTKNFQNFITQTGVFTISFKAKRDSAATFDTVMDSRDANPNTFGWAVHFNNAGYLYVSAYNDDNVVFSGGLPFGVDSTTWNSYSLVGDGSNIVFYVNGSSVGTISTITGANLGSDQTIPTTISSSIFPFSGLIDDIVIDDRVWSAQELTDYTNNDIFDYSKKIFEEYDAGGGTTVGFDSTNAALIVDNKKSDGTTEFDLTEIQRRDFWKLVASTYGISYPITPSINHDYYIDLGITDPSWTITGTSVVSTPVGNARSFNGTSDVVDTNDTMDISTSTDFTIAVKLNRTDSDVVYLFSTWEDSSRISGMGLYVNANNTISLAGGGAGAIVNSSVAIPTNEWCTLIITRGANDSGSTMVYINGISVAKTSFPNTIAGTHYDTMVGNRVGATTYFGGEIKEIIADNRIWSAEEIAAYVP